MTAIRYALCDEGPAASIYKTADDAVLAAGHADPRTGCRTVGVEVIPPDDAWSDSYVIEAGSPQWERIAARAARNLAGPPEPLLSPTGGTAEGPFVLYLRAPNWDWAPVASLAGRDEADQAREDLVAVVGPRRVRLAAAGE
ncbi:MAG: hypothetical protein ACLFWM_00115 [Actinomycetota bacterium]